MSKCSINYVLSHFRVSFKMLISECFLISESVCPRDGVSRTGPYPCNQAQYKRLTHTAETVSVYTVAEKLRPSPSINFFYPKAKSKHQFNYSMDRHEKSEEHEFVRPDENTKFPSQSTNPKHPNVNLKNNYQYIPEDSCDRRPSKSQEPSAVEELQALMQSVRETSVSSKEAKEKPPDGTKICKVESSMEVEYEKEKSSVSVPPNLEMVEEPEESYRARYESEGCRGPIRGVNENGCPTVRVNGYSGSVIMTVFLVTECGEPHLHSITGPGSTKTVCKEITLDGNIPAIQTVLGPEQNMTAVWDSLSVRRIRNWDADKKLRERGDNPAAWKAKKKEARLMFQCTIPRTADRLGYILTCQSRPFMCIIVANANLKCKLPIHFYKAN
eukprot:Seg4215.1 transcript_id=Seg4215.1/GoldUCD/mRNA.D3Y31 product="Nuclear factor of activated T-cells 5" protein_id=Seg4215.1/GoldUCD/D3Y31